MALQFILNGYDLTQYVKPKSWTFTDLPGGEVGQVSLVLEGPYYPATPALPLIDNPAFPVSLAVTMPDPDDTGGLTRYRPDGGHTMVVREDSDPVGINIFVGSILRKPENPIVRLVDGDFHYTYKATAATAGWTLDNHTVTDIYVEKQTGFIFADVVRNKAPDFSLFEDDLVTPTVPTSGPAAGRFRRPQYVTQRRKVREVLDDLAASEGWTWYITEAMPFSLTGTKRIHLGPRQLQMDSYQITEANVDDLFSTPPEIDRGDLSQVRNIIWFNYFSFYETSLITGATPGSTNPEDYTHGLVTVSNGTATIAPAGTRANFASFVKPGAVFQIPGSNYRYTVAQVFDTGNVILNTPILELSGTYQFTFSNIPAVIKLREQASIDTLKALLGGGDNGEREFPVTDNRMMTFAQAIEQARTHLNERANPMVRMTLKTDTHKLRKAVDWAWDGTQYVGTKFYPKAGRAVSINLPTRNIVSTQIQKQIRWKDTGAPDDDGRTVIELEIDFSDRLFALTTIFRKLIDGELNGFQNQSLQSVYDVIDINEYFDFANGGENGEVTLTAIRNPFMREDIALQDAMAFNTAPGIDVLETMPVSDNMTVGSLASPANARWVDGATPATERAMWGQPFWVNVP